jgi:hypothetical protein
MNTLVIKSALKRSIGLSLIITITACGLNPHNAETGQHYTLPEAKSTVYEKAMSQYGLMQNIYDVRIDASGRDDNQDYSLRVMVKNIADVTGASIGSQYEIPQNVTEMVRSTLNSIGGRILYVPFDSGMMDSLKGLDYTDFRMKKVPDVILSGGITEFDRSLVTEGESIDLGIDIIKKGGIEGSDQVKTSISGITLDFNLEDFQNQVGIPKMQAIYNIKVHKSTREDSIGFTIKSATFGARGDIKRIQGRHEAVRMIIQLSMLQILGRYQKLPYWMLVPGASRDEVVMEQVLNDFYRLPENEKVKKEQEYLYLHGYGVSVTGQMDNSTQAALDDFTHKAKLSEFTSYTSDTRGKVYLALFESVPIGADTLRMRNNINSNVAITPTVSAHTKLSPSSIQTGNVSISTDKTEYRIGDTMRLGFSVSKPMYVRIIVVNSKGEISTLLPNDYQQSNFLQPNVNYTIPPQNANFSLDIGLPVGTDKIHAIASDTPISAQSIIVTSSGALSSNTIAKYPVHSTIHYTIRK